MPIIYFELLFQKLDEEKNCHISDINIFNFLLKNSIICTENEIKSIINLYDINRDNSLNYKEFLYMILSNEKLLDKKINFKFSYTNNDLPLSNLPYNIEYDFCKILENELCFIRDLEEKINDLNKRKDYTIYDLFNELKDENKNEISFAKLESFLKRNKINLKNGELKQLIKRLDINKDSSITIDDICVLFGKDIFNSKIFYKEQNIDELSYLKLISKSNKENLNNINNIKIKENIAQNLILEFYFLLIEVEKLIETEKIELSQKSDFNIDDALNIFQKGNSEYITGEELKNGLHNLGVIVNNNEVELLMKKYCTNEDYILDNSDFFDMLVPFDKNYREIIENRKPLPYMKNNKIIFSDLTRESLVNFFKIIISCEITIEKKRQYLKENYNINFKNFYNKIDTENKGFIFINDFISFFNRLNPDIEEKYIYLLFLRLDRKKNGMIEQIDLINEITPKIKYF